MHNILTKLLHTTAQKIPLIFKWSFFPAKPIDFRSFFCFLCDVQYLVQYIEKKQAIRWLKSSLAPNVGPGIQLSYLHLDFLDTLRQFILYSGISTLQILFFV